MKSLSWDLLHETGIHCLLVALAWSCSWLATSDDYGYGILSALFSLLAAAIIAGNFVRFIELPSLVGMIMVGFLIRNSTEFSGSSLYIIDSGWSSAIRSCALVVILLRAGLGIDIDNVRRLSWSVLRLAILPNLIEATVDALIAINPDYSREALLKVDVGRWSEHGGESHGERKTGLVRITNGTCILMCFHVV